MLVDSQAYKSYRVNKIFFFFFLEGWGGGGAISVKYVYFILQLLYCIRQPVFNNLFSAHNTLLVKEICTDEVPSGLKSGN